MEIEINGLNVHYETQGEGVPFLILHGWGSNTERWKEVAELLARSKVKVITVDLPGFGQSAPLAAAWDTNKYIRFVEAFVGALGLGEFYLLGHSFGGALACKVAITHNQKVKKLFLVAAAYVRKKTARKRASYYIAKLLGLFSFLPFYQLFRKAVYKFLLKSDYEKVEGTMKQTYLKVISEDISFQIPFIKVPTVIIWGDHDDATPFEDATMLNAQIKNSVLEVIPGAGHDLNRKNQEVLVEKIIKHL